MIFVDCQEVRQTELILELLEGELANIETHIEEELDNMADCSGDELGDGSTSTDEERLADISGEKEKLKMELEAIDGSESESSDDEETKILAERKRQLEEEKRRLKDERQRKRQLREKKKIQLKAEVETLENEVATLSAGGKDRVQRR